ncbi:MAG: putative sugar O-methyltransferase [Rhodospirillaceae bacterium]|nr:putative sugar O-methyltransferase [Rhodospirillaceae bacterium]
MNTSPQIPDDFELLDLMMADLSAAPEAFQPTAYWQYYQNRTVQFLRNNGLHNIRRQQDPGITCFGCYEGPLLPTKKQLLDMGLSEAEAEVSKSFGRLLERNPHQELLALNRSISQALRLELEVLSLKAELACPNAVSIFELDCSVAGNPTSSFRVDGNWYTPRIFEKYRHYIEFVREFDPTTLETIVEIGPGMGQQVEALRKLHPHLSFVLVDIPPQLYVSHQYLKEVFGDDAIDYRSTRGSKITGLQPGKITFIGPWDLAGLEPRGRTALWNACSFQEMSEPVVEGYFEIFRHFARDLFLLNVKDGLAAEVKTIIGSNDTIDLDFYTRVFDPDYERLNVYPVEGLNDHRKYRVMTWRHRHL